MLVDNISTNHKYNQGWHHGVSSSQPIAFWVTQQDIFKDTLGYLQLFLWLQNWLFFSGSQTISTVVVNKTGILSQTVSYPIPN